MGHPFVDTSDATRHLALMWCIYGYTGQSVKECSRVHSASLQAVLGAELLGLGPASGLLGEAGAVGLGVEAVVAASCPVVGGLVVVDGVGPTMAAAPAQ